MIVLGKKWVERKSESFQWKKLKLCMNLIVLMMPAWIARIPHSAQLHNLVAFSRRARQIAQWTTKFRYIHREFIQQSRQSSVNNWMQFPLYYVSSHFIHFHARSIMPPQNFYNEKFIRLNKSEQSRVQFFWCHLASIRSIQPPRAHTQSFPERRVEILYNNFWTASKGILNLSRNDFWLHNLQ